MAGKVTELAENTTPALTDIMEIVDDPGGTPASQKVTLANLLALAKVTNLLDYRASTDLHSATAVSSTTWTDVGANQNFTVTDASAQIAASVSGGVTVGNNANQLSVGFRLVIDSAGTPIYRYLGGFLKPANAFANGVCSCPPLPIGTLSAAVHTIKLQIYLTTGDNMYLRASSPTIEMLSLQVWQIR